MDIHSQYLEAINTADAAWDAFEDARKSGFAILAAQKHGAFRRAYEKKLALHGRLLAANKAAA